MYFLKYSDIVFYLYITKLFLYDFSHLSQNVIKYSPLLKLNKLVEKKNNNDKFKTKLDKEINKTNKWIEFSIKNQEITNLNEKFKTYCIVNQADPIVVNQQLQNENVFISKKQLKKQVFIYKKNLNQYQVEAMQCN